MTSAKWGRAKAHALCACLSGIAASATAAPYVPVFGAPFHSAAAGGYYHPGDTNSTDPGGGVVDVAVNSAGTAVGWGTFHNAPGTYLGDRAFRWDGSGAPGIELGHFGTFADGTTFSYPLGLSPSGTIVGSVYRFDAADAYVGRRAVRWPSGSNTPVELGHLGTSPSGYTVAEANAVNAAGTAVGYADKHDAGGASRGSPAVRWDAAATAATELSGLGTDATGATYGDARAINIAGATVGYADKYDAAGVYKGSRPVRWDSATTTATELATLGTSTTGAANGIALLINDAGTIIGQATKYDAAGADKGTRPVRWDAGGTAVVELAVLGTDSGGKSTNRVKAINAAGMIVGFATKYNASGTSLGDRAVRWDPGSAAVTELVGLGTSTAGFTNARANDIDDAGNIVGYATKFNAQGISQGARAVYWAGGSGSPLDLNTLIDPGSGWTLTTAMAISDGNNWVLGVGSFDPDGFGGEPSENRLFLMQLPEPTAVVPAVLLALALRRHSRRHARSGSNPTHCAASI